MPTGKRKFVRLSLRNIAGKIGRISRGTIGKWLRQRKFSLRSNVKRLSGPPHPDRDRQFKLIKRATTRFKNAGQPIISVDAKNKEKIGDFKNDGVKWEEVDAHDFANKKTLTATPFAIYDLTKNEALVEVGTSKNTSRFAVDSIWRWWVMYGVFAYATASRLLILADSGGSNGCRVWMWKKQLQEFADETGLTITVRHYPRGASKWNPAEDRVFGPISRNWAGHPLRTMSVFLGFVRGTTTQTGLKVRAHWNRRKYKTKEKVSKEEQKKLNFKRHKVIPLWNYTIYPRCKTQ